VKAFCALTKRQAALYGESVEALAREIAALASRDPKDDMRRRGLVLSYLMRLKQICNHPSQWLGDGAYAPGESGKFARLAEIAEVVASRQEKALVFTQFREMAAPIERFPPPTSPSRRAASVPRASSRGSGRAAVSRARSRSPGAPS
jgi:SNF2 family DNA or RNA helicase